MNEVFIMHLTYHVLSKCLQRKSIYIYIYVCVCVYINIYINAVGKPVGRYIYYDEQSSFNIYYLL